MKHRELLVYNLPINGTMFVVFDNLNITDLSMRKYRQIGKYNKVMVEFYSGLKNWKTVITFDKQKTDECLICFELD